MCTFGNISLIGALALIVGCSSSSSSGAAGTGGYSSNGGTGSTVGGTGTTLGGNASTGNCNMPSCVMTLMSSCVPSGTCTSQLDMATFNTSMCFSNGVKVGMVIDMTSGAATMTFKNGTTTCYSILETADASGNGQLTFKNASGATVATGTRDANRNVTTITCPGGQPVTLNSDCSSPVPSSDTTTCTNGTCTL